MRPIETVVQQLTNEDEAAPTATDTGTEDVPVAAWTPGPATVTRLPGGRVNDTFLVAVTSPGGRTRSFVVQRLNGQVFGDPLAVVRNFRRVVEHLDASPGRVGPTVPVPVTTLTGADHVQGPDGSVWRARTYLAGERFAGRATLPDVERVARAFGALARDLRALDHRTLEPVLPGLHVLSSAVRRLERAAVHAGAVRRAAVLVEVDRARRLFERVERSCHRWGLASLPVRVVHNDAKLANVVLGRSGPAIVDFDLAGAGTVCADIGDLVRSACDHTVGIAPETVQTAVVRAWQSGAGDLLTAEEGAALQVAAPLVACELGMRYLTDTLVSTPALRTDGRSAVERARWNLDLAAHLLAAGERDGSGSS